MKPKSLLASFMASIITGLGMPPLFMLASMFPRWGKLSGYDVEMSYLVFGPFTLIGVFAVAAPSYMLQRNDRGLWQKAIISMSICAVAAVVMLLPVADRIPWEGSAFGIATFLIWLGAYSLIRSFRFNSDSIRSEPSG